MGGNNGDSESTFFQEFKNICEKILGVLVSRHFNANEGLFGVIYIIFDLIFINMQQLVQINRKIHRKVNDMKCNIMFDLKLFLIYNFYQE